MVFKLNQQNVYLVLLNTTYLSWKQCVGIESLHIHNKIVIRKDHILDKLPVQEKPVRATIYSDAFWNLSIPKTPHVCVTFQKQPVQALFSDEPVKRYRLIKRSVTHWINKKKICTHIMLAHL